MEIRLRGGCHPMRTMNPIRHLPLERDGKPWEFPELLRRRLARVEIPKKVLGQKARGHIPGRGSMFGPVSPPWANPYARPKRKGRAAFRPETGIRPSPPIGGYNKIKSQTPQGFPTGFGVLSMGGRPLGLPHNLGGITRAPLRHRLR